MRSTIVAVWHGETEWNSIGKQQGHLDSGLTGVKQAEAMAEGLKPHRVDCCYSSDLGRAVQTAEIISRALGIPFETNAGLRERHLGVLQGLTYKEFEEKYPDEVERFKGRDPDYRIPEGESVRERFERSIACVESLTFTHPGRTILIVTHGGVLKSFLHKALGISLAVRRTYSLLNAAINRFSISEANEWRLESWGETGHLRSRGISTMDDY